MQKEKAETKSPIEDKPLRYPAQSLDEKLDDLFVQKFLVYIISPIIFIMIAFNAWISYFNKVIPNPYLLTVIAIIVTVWSYYKFSTKLNEVKALKQGRDGEREVGMNLELLREQGFKVYHDIIGKDFNLDHVLVGTKGIYVIETKTYSKPLKGQCKIVYDGKKLSYNGTIESDKPIIQAKAGAQWLKNYLKETTKKEFDVFPVVVFPGWFTESKVPLKDIWILNPKGLEKFMQNKQNELLDEDVALVANRIEMYVRNFANKNNF